MEICTSIRVKLSPQFHFSISIISFPNFAFNQCEHIYFSAINFLLIYFLPILIIKPKPGFLSSLTLLREIRIVA
jgi:hypothetical protein